MRVLCSVPRIRSACAVGLLLLAHGAAHGQTPVQAAAAQGVPPKAPTLRETTIPDAFAGIPFNVSVQAADGAAEVVVTLHGVLPDGLTFQSGAKTLAISGIPQETGSFDLEITATDGYGLSAHGKFTLFVRPRPLSGPPTSVITDKEGVTVTDTDNVFFPAKIADAEAVHVTDTDTVFMPAVIKVTETVAITDTDNVFMPAAIKVTENVSVIDTVKVFFAAVIADNESITVTDSHAVAANIGVSPSTAPAGTYNTAYSVQFSPAGADGTPSLVPSGNLPSGMSFVTSNGNVILHGTPTVTGSFPFTITASNSGNSVVDVIHYTLVVNPAAQTIQFGTAPSPTYGGAAFNVTATASSGLPVTISVLSGPVSGTGPYTPTGAGPVVFQAVQGGNADYSPAPTLTLNVTIAQAPLTVTATNMSRVFDQPNPAFTYTISGFVNNDPPSVVTGSPVLSTTATPISPVSVGGPYPIDISIGTLAAANYSFAFSPGNLTVTAAPQTITFYPLPSIVHGSAAFPLTARASSGLAVSYTVSGTAGATISNSMLTVSGPGTVTVTATQAGNANYNAAASVARSFTAQ